MNPPKVHLFVLTPKWKSPPRSKGRLPASDVCRVLKARLWYSQKVPVAGPIRVLGRKAVPLSLAGTARKPAEYPSKDHLSTQNHCHTVNRPALLPALCQILSPPGTLWYLASQLLPFPHPPSINLQDLSGQLGQAPSHDASSRHERDWPFTQVGGPPARQAALWSWAGASPGSDVLNPPLDSLSISPLNPAQRTPPSARSGPGSGGSRDGKFCCQSCSGVRPRNQEKPASWKADAGSGRGERTRGPCGVAAGQRPSPHPPSPTQDKTLGSAADASPPGSGEGALE